jgi:ankyrin repeat protein
VKAEWEQAAKRGDERTIAARIRAGDDVDALDRFGQSALMLAARHGHLEVVRVLIDAGADLDRTAKFDLSATMLAVVNGHDSVALALAEAGADLGLVGSGAPGFAGRSAVDLARDRGADALARSLEARRPSG